MMDRDQAMQSNHGHTCILIDQLFSKWATHYFIDNQNFCSYITNKVEVTKKEKQHLKKSNWLLKLGIN